jgi:hypothetical protein
MEAVIGVLIGLVASAGSALAAYWWKAKQDLNMAAVQCYDRLKKLQQAQGLPDNERTKVNDNETFLLGGHMDLYRTSLAQALLTRSRRRRYVKAYESMIEVLIKRDHTKNDPTKLKATIDDLAPLVNAPTDAG